MWERRFCRSLLIQVKELINTKHIVDDGQGCQLRAGLHSCEYHVVIVKRLIYVNLRVEIFVFHLKAFR